ncbi:hypothetical protein TWF506_003026 [Arthrobotrys conoides]|uniref:Uncharacterized protein n=1 Tax=Arthrobotrys conoides TaxID=74498 RepID=A0AAN8NDZ3_9PEZI
MKAVALSDKLLTIPRSKLLGEVPDRKCGACRIRSAWWRNSKRLPLRAWDTNEDLYDKNIMEIRRKQGGYRISCAAASTGAICYTKGKRSATRARASLLSIINESLPLAIQPGSGADDAKHYICEYIGKVLLVTQV